jgi:hypothetical protein
MIYIFGVSIRGSISLLLALSMLLTVCSLGLGLLVSTLAKTQPEAFQFAFVIMLPSVLLSGFGQLSDHNECFWWISVVPSLPLSGIRQTRVGPVRLCVG